MRSVRVPCVENSLLFIGCETGDRSAAVRAHNNVSRAVSAIVRSVRPDARAGDVSRVLKPANSGSGSHSGSERGPDQRLMSWLSRKARSTQVNVQDEPTASAQSARNSPARVRWPDTIKITGQTRLRGMHDPLGEIAHVDELDRIIRRSRDQHLAASIKPHRPIGETPRRILGPTINPALQTKASSPIALLTRDLGRPIGLFGAVLDLRAAGARSGAVTARLSGRAVVTHTH